MHWAELWKLSGVAIVVIGLALRLRTTLVVVVAALVTGLVAGLPLLSDSGVFHGIPVVTRPAAADGSASEGIIDMLGRAFADNRLMTLFIITLPAIGLAERFGLQEQAATLIRRIRAATVGRLQIVYQLLRVLMGAMGLRLYGHAAFVRPLVYPMALGAAELQTEAQDASELSTSQVESIKASSAASENYGNFYGQNLSMVQAGILLVFTVLKSLGYEVSVGRLVLFAIPVTLISVILGGLQFLWLDRRFKPRERSRE